MANAKMTVMLLLLLMASVSARLAVNSEAWPIPRAMKSSPGHGHGPPSSECKHKCSNDHKSCRIKCAPISIPDGGECNENCDFAFDRCKNACMQLKRKKSEIKNLEQRDA